MAEERSGRTLNPFAFPSETELRSVLLIWAVLVLCWALGFLFTGIVLSNAGWPWPDDLPELDRDIWGTRANAENLALPVAMMRSETILAEKLAALSQPEERKRTLDALSRLSGAARRRLNVALPYLFIPFLFVLLTALVIWGYSLGRARRLWFVRLAKAKPWEIDALQETLDPLVEEARSLQLKLGEREVARPRFLLSRGARADGQAYGTSRRPLIVLSRAVPLILRKEIRSHGKAYKVRAILFHELAHLANRDVTRSYLAEASWIVLIPVLVFVAAVLWMTWVSVEGAQGAMQNPAVISVQVLGTLLVVELIRRGVLRGREHFADLRAGVLWNVIEPLRASLQPETGSETTSGTLFRLWSKHPGTVERRRVLDDPGLVFAIRNDAALLAGLLFGSLLVSAILLTGMLVMATDGAANLLVIDLTHKYAEEKSLAFAMRFYYRLGQFLWSLAMIASAIGFPLMVLNFMARTLGVQVQRESVLQVVERRLHPHPYRALWRPAFLAAVGFEIGILLVPFGSTLPGSAGAVLGSFLWVGYATLLLWMWLSAIRFFARRILGRHVAARKPARRLKWMTRASAVLLLPVVVALMGAQLWIWPDVRSVGGRATLTFGCFGLLIFVSLLVLMLFALGIWQAGREGTWKPRCPSCQHDPGKTTVADRCAACGGSLAPWLYVAGHDMEGRRNT